MCYQPAGGRYEKIITAFPFFEISRTFPRDCSLLHTGCKGLEGFDTVYSARLSTNDNFSTKMREDREEKKESHGLLLYSLDLNCFSGPHAEITLLFFEPLGLNGVLSCISPGTREGRMKQTSMAGLIILQSFTWRACRPIGPCLPNLLCGCILLAALNWRIIDRESRGVC